MVAHLSHQHHKDIVGEAWVQVSEVYYYHEDLFEESKRSNKDFAATVVATWEMRRQDLSIRLGYLPEVPDYIQKLVAMVTNATMASLASIELSGLGMEGQDALTVAWDDLGI